MTATGNASPPARAYQAVIGDYDAVHSALSTYRNQLLYELRNLPIEVESSPPDAPVADYERVRVMVDTLTYTATPSWDVLAAAESLLIERLPEARLRRRTWFIRDQFAAVVGPEKAARYLASSPPDAEKGQAHLLRADLLEVEREIARHYTFGSESEQERGVLVRRIRNVAAVLLFALTLTLLSVSNTNIFWCILVGAIVLGLIAFAYRRSRTLPVTAIVLALMLSTTALAQDQLVTGTSPAPNDTTTSADTGGTDTGGTDTAGTDTAGTDTARTDTAETNTAGSDTSGTGTNTAGTTATDTTGTNPPVQLPPRVETADRAGIPTILMVAFAGVLGATFSILQRAQRTGSDNDPMLALLALRAAQAHVLLSILSGGIAALVAYAIFAGGMLEGGLFPKMTGDGHASANVSMRFMDFFNWSGPDEFVDHGKLLVWAFIAGFAERFVPDILDRFTAGATKK